MSEMINNREYRHKILKELITELHNGKSVDDVKARFEKLIEGISAVEISEMEQALMMEGMPVEEIQRLCDVHVAVFKGSIEEIHKVQRPEDILGHPLNTFKRENRELEKLIKEKINPDLETLSQNGSKENIYKLTEDINLLLDIDKHYSKKENLLFPIMENHDITAPPKVMWALHDEIRKDIKDSRGLLVNYNGDIKNLSDKVNQTVNKVTEMIYKEENILFPMVSETLSEDEWIQIAEASMEIGYCLVEPKGKWSPVRVNVEQKGKEKGEKQANLGYIKFETGILLPGEINGILNTLPFEITFVDKDGTVKYFSNGKDRIFVRPKTIIGRQVANCHPPASVHIVEKIVEDFMSGKKDHEDFWIKMGPKYVYIRYFAVRNDTGEYLGTMEVTQDIKPIQDISEEKRL